MSLQSIVPDTKQMWYTKQYELRKARTGAYISQWESIFKIQVIYFWPISSLRETHGKVYKNLFGRQDWEMQSVTNKNMMQQKEVARSLTLRWQDRDCGDLHKPFCLLNGGENEMMQLVFGLRMNEQDACS